MKETYTYSLGRWRRQNHRWWRTGLRWCRSWGGWTLTLLGMLLWGLLIMFFLLVFLAFLCLLCTWPVNGFKQRCCDQILCCLLCIHIPHEVLSQFLSLQYIYLVVVLSGQHKLLEHPVRPGGHVFETLQYLGPLPCSAWFCLRYQNFRTWHLSHAMSSICGFRFCGTAFPATASCRSRWPTIGRCILSIVPARSAASGCLGG